MLLKNNINRLKIFVVVIFVCFLIAFYWHNTVSVRSQETPANTQTEKTPETSNDNSANTTTTEPKPAETVKPQEPPMEGCLKCHNNIEPMHRYNARGDVFDKLDNGKDAQGLNCTACHGGNPAAITQKDAHVQPKFPKDWNCKNGECSSRNPERANTLLLKESNEFVRFINPGDFRVITQTCGECHSDENRTNSRSMMAHGAMLWGAALYNNGGFHIKDTRFGESYNEDGNPQTLLANPQPTREEEAFKGFLPFLEPLPRWEISQPGNILRVFERGGRRRLEVGLPDKEEENGKPDKGLSPRGLGTLNRTDPVYLGLQKTRLMDPTLNMLGTNDHPGDFRSAGCTSCHVIYANDRSSDQLGVLFNGRQSGNVEICRRKHSEKRIRDIR